MSLSTDFSGASRNFERGEDNVSASSFFANGNNNAFYTGKLPKRRLIEKKNSEPMGRVRSPLNPPPTNFEMLYLL